MELRNGLDKTAVLALISIALSSNAAMAADSSAKRSATGPGFKIAEKGAGGGKGADSACGKGSCGTDKKGADAALKKHAHATGKGAGKESTSKEKASGATDKSK